MRTEKPPKSLIPIAILFAVGIFLLIYYLISPVNTTVEVANNDSASTEASSPTPLSANIEKSSDSTVSESSSASVMPTTPASVTKGIKTIADSSINSPAAESSIQIRIVDALGDPIQKGIVQINGQTKEFTDGEIRIDHVPPGQHQITASSDGYQSVAKEQNFPSQENVTVEMEYLNSFECKVVRKVGQDNLRPISGAEVFVYPGPKIVRPVNNNITIPVHTVNQGIAQIQITRNKDNNFFITNSPAILNMMDMRKSIGDQVIGFNQFTEHRTEFPENISKRLRIWDSLNAYNSFPASKCSMIYEELVLSRESTTYKVTLPLMFFEDEIKPVTQGISGVNGICRFNNLPAGTYFVQSRQNQSRSQIGVLHPCHRYEDLFLSEKTSLYIDVKRSISIGLSSAAIPNAKITLQSAENDSKALFMALTDRFGNANIEQIPFGHYQLTVTPPDTMKQAPQIVQVNLNDEKKSIVILFEEESYLVSGKMLFADSKEPVSGFPLTLVGFIKRSEDLPYSELGNTKPVYTNSDGSFQFDGVPPGKYGIELTVTPWDVVPLYEKELLSASKQTAIDDRGNFEVIDKDITGLEYIVEREVITQIDGIVLDKSGNPVSSARILFDKGFYHFVEKNPVTGNDGRFHLSIKTKSSLNTDSISIAAYVKKPVEPVQPNAGERNGGGGGGGALPRVPDPKTIQCWGESLISFKAGTKVENIKIVVDVPENHISISGKITTADGKPYSKVRINTYQDKGSIPGIVNPDGSYYVTYLDPGAVKLMVDPDQVRQFIPQFGFRDVVPVCDQSHQLTIPQQGTLQFDIHLVNSTSISGMVKDKQNMPSSYCTITAYKGDDLASRDSTDKRGFFYLGYLKPDASYRLVIQNPDISKKPLSILENVKPQKNLVVVIEKPD